MTDSKKQKQLEREKHSASCGYDTFMKNEEDNRKHGNASNNVFSRQVKEQYLADIMDVVKAKASKVVGYNASEVALILKQCLKATADGETTQWFDHEEAAFIGLQLTLDTAMNPNTVSGKEIGKHGGEKWLMAKKTVSQLEAHIGKTIHHRMTIRFIDATFPSWFKVVNKSIDQGGAKGVKPTTSQWKTNIEHAINAFAERLRSEGKHADADLIDNRKMWTHHECSVIGSLVLSAVVESLPYLELQTQTIDRKNVQYIVLTELGQKREAWLREYVAKYSHDVLPMLVEPELITNEDLGGWKTDALRSPEQSHNGSIVLSSKHLQFINQQAKVPFEINPFTYQLMQLLVDAELPLGKFHYQSLQDIPDVAQQLGYGHIDNSNGEQTKLVKAHPDTKRLTKQKCAIIEANLEKVKNSLFSRLILNKAKKVLDDDYFYLPMKYDMRGRIYSRVPFISFQSNDAGRYLLRFHNKTPIDARTEHWLKIGISNAGGNDKLSWDQRISWFDKNRAEIINVGRMVDGGDFTRAYEFLTQDHIEDAFCLAALANEYVQVFVDRTKTYTQCYVCVDASCSGTSIFNAWRRNLHGAAMTNLINTSEPADIYLEVWREMRRLMPDGVFRTRHLNRLERSKLLRKMMKSSYVPASYASPVSEQRKRLKAYNQSVLKPQNLHFTDKELPIVLDLWEVALDKVSSINTVVNWFRARTAEALEHQDFIKLTSCNGSAMTLKYPKTTLKRKRVLRCGSALYAQRSMETVEPGAKPNKRKLLDSVTANCTHFTDSAALCEALFDCETPFIAIHDACGMPPGQLLDCGIQRLKRGFIEATRHNVWDQFRLDNNLPLDHQTAGPIIGDLDLELIMDSNYLFS